MIGAHSTGDGSVPIHDKGDGTTPNPTPDITVPTPDSGDGRTLNPDVRGDTNDNNDASYNHRWGQRHGSDHYNLRPRFDPASNVKHLI